MIMSLCHRGKEIEYGSRVLITSRLAAVHLSELRLGKSAYLKDGSLSRLAQNNPQ